VFQSHRGDGAWSTPTRVELSGGAHKSEIEAFFSRYDEEGGISNIYWISAEVIEDAAPA